MALRNPFLVPDNNLHSLSTGLVLTEGDDINREKAEDVGRTIQDALDNAFFNDASVKRNDQVKSLEVLQQSTKTTSGGDQSVDSIVMFIRIATIAAQ